jgi:two-component system chemotaxis response regulator CheB
MHNMKRQTKDAGRIDHGIIRHRAQPCVHNSGKARFPVLNGEFRLKAISKPRGWPDVIAVFMRSLTEHWNGIAIIVSGYDGDGVAALCGIQEVGGITIAQKPDTAGQPDMPESAIASGCIDFILAPEKIAQEIVRIAHAALRAK